MKLTRRKLALALVSAATPAAQTQSAAPDGEITAARERFKAAANALAKHEIPTSTEPAFQFKA